MSRHIDLTSVLSTEKPSIIIGDKEYVINDEKTNILAMNAEISKMQKKGVGEVEIIDFTLEKLLGKKSAKEIDGLGISLLGYQNIYFALIACINDEDADTVKARFQQQQR